MTAITYDDMRKGCWDRDERMKDLELNYVDGSLPFPTFPRFCGQTFHEAEDNELGAGLREGQQRLDGRGVVRPVGRRQHPALHHPALGRASSRPRRSKRNAERGVRAIAFSEIPTRLKLPSINTDYWDPAVGGVQRLRASRCACTSARRRSNPVASPDSHPAVGGTLGFNNAMASLADWLFSGNLLRFPKLKLAYSEGQIGWIPYVLERADTVWEQHDAWQHAKDRIPDAAVDAVLRTDLRLLHCRPSRPALPRRGRRGQHLLRDRLPAHRHDVATLRGLRREDLLGLTDEQAYKILRGNAIKMLELDRV